MASYDNKLLNGSGLSYLWNKIVARFNLKQDKLTAGTNITIDANNEISATAPDEVFIGTTTPTGDETVWINPSAVDTMGFVPSGGTQGQLLSKSSATDFDTQWMTPNYELVSNKINSWSATASPDKYPSEALVTGTFNYITANYTHNPVLIYDKTNKMHVAGTVGSGKDDANGLINQGQGEGTSHNITSWNIEGMDLSEFRYIRVVFRRNNSSYAVTGEFNIPLDGDPVDNSGINIYVSGTSMAAYGDRNRLIVIGCAVDSTKSKFCVTQTITLYGTMVTATNEIFVERIYGCY